MASAEPLKNSLVILLFLLPRTASHRIFVEVARVMELCHFTPFRMKGFKDV